MTPRALPSPNRFTVPVGISAFPRLRRERAAEGVQSQDRYSLNSFSTLVNITTLLALPIRREGLISDEWRSSTAAGSQGTASATTSSRTT
jgi:hypothetical protein